MHLKNELEELDPLRPEQVIMSFVLQSKSGYKQWYTFLKIDNLKQYYITHKMAGLTEELNVGSVQNPENCRESKSFYFVLRWTTQLEVVIYSLYLYFVL